jgi:hypothetical protein
VPLAAAYGQELATDLLGSVLEYNDSTTLCSVLNPVLSRNSADRGNSLDGDVILS